VSGPHGATDDLAFFAADLGETKVIAASNVAAQLSTVQGKLPAGRYLVHIADLSDPNAKVWIRLGKFGDTVPVAAAVPSFPMSLSTIAAIEYTAREGHSDQIAAVTSAGTANVYVTRVSRDG